MIDNTFITESLILAGISLVFIINDNCLIYARPTNVLSVSHSTAVQNNFQILIRTLRQSTANRPRQLTSISSNVAKLNMANPSTISSSGRSSTFANEAVSSFTPFINGPGVEHRGEGGLPCLMSASRPSPPGPGRPLPGPDVDG